MNVHASHPEARCHRRAACRILMSQPGMREHEMGMLANLLPETAAEARELVPSLQVRCLAPRVQGLQHWWHGSVVL